MTLKPFFCYFGGKWRATKNYPIPKFNIIYEPFAGGAGYSLHYYSKNIYLYEIDPVIYGLWNYLINVKKSEILSIPIGIEHVDEINSCQEAKWLVGFWFNKGSTGPRLSASTWAKSGIRPNSYWGEVIRDRIANQVEKIRHWKVYNKSYLEINNDKSTWFIDPPYQCKAGRNYRYTLTDYDLLSEWCQSRLGQTIVCEQLGANWLPFQYLTSIKSTPGSKGKSYSDEVIWINSKD